MTFARKNGGRVYLSEAVVEKLMANRQLCSSAPEAGGVMLGRLIVGSLDVVVDEAVGPFAGDKRSRFSFFRPRRKAQQIVDQAWVGSCGTKIYLGDWHTHPEDDPNHSDQDLRNWGNICQMAVFEQESLFFLIAGRIIVRIWEQEKNGTPQELTRM